MWKRQIERIEASQRLGRRSEQSGDIAALILFLLGVYDPFVARQDTDASEPLRMHCGSPTLRPRCAEPMHRCRVSQRAAAQIAGVLTQRTTR